MTRFSDICHKILYKFSLIWWQNTLNLVTPNLGLRPLADEIQQIPGKLWPEILPDLVTIFTKSGHCLISRQSKSQKRPKNGESSWERWADKVVWPDFMQIPPDLVTNAKSGHSSLKGNPKILDHLESKIKANPERSVFSLLLSEIFPQKLVQCDQFLFTQILLECNREEFVSNN